MQNFQIRVRFVHPATTIPYRTTLAAGILEVPLCSVEVAVETIEQVGHSNLKVTFDCYHVQIMQGDLTERIQRFLPFIGHIQIAGVPDRNEPDKGEVNYITLCESLDSLGYNGDIGAEYRPSKPMAESLSWLEHFAVR